MQALTIAALLQLISAAVTPVVMISACAALILGINNKHGSLSMQIRGTIADMRRVEPGSRRLTQLRRQLFIFNRRFRITQAALFSLYGAIGIFTATVLFILLAQKRMLISTPALGGFVFGAILMGCAALLEAGEVFLAGHALRIEMEDVLEENAAAQAGRPAP